MLTYSGNFPKKRKIFGSNSIAKAFTHHSKPVDGHRALHELFSNHKATPPIVIWMESYYQSEAATTEKGFYWQTLTVTPVKGQPVYMIIEPGSLLSPFAPASTVLDTIEPYEHMQDGTAANHEVDDNTYQSGNAALIDSFHGWKLYIISHAYLSMKIENKHQFDVFVGIRMRLAEVATDASTIVNSFVRKSWHLMSNGGAGGADPLIDIDGLDIETLQHDFQGIQFTRIQGRGFEADDPTAVAAAGFPGNPKFMRQKKVEFNLDMNKFRNELAPHGWDKFDNAGTMNTLTAPATRILFELILIPCDARHALLPDEIASTSVFALDRVVIHEMKLRQKTLFFNSFKRTDPLHGPA